MRVIIAHNFYLLPGGEDEVFRNEIDLLRRHGIDVHEYIVENKQILEMNQLQLGINAVWSSNSYKQMEIMLRSIQPDLVHFHNTFPIMSPSVYHACQSANVPVIQTLHNYRLFCLSALLTRNGQICLDCLHKAFPWPGIVHSCYRSSLTASMGVGLMLTVHRCIGTWKRCIDSYIALTGFARQLFIEIGLDANKLYTKPNFIYPDPGPKRTKGQFALFIGRLSPEKGVLTLLHAWSCLKNIPLQIIGDGPEKKRIDKLVQDQKLSHIIVTGQLPKEEVLSRLKNARFTVLPSIWFEGMPMVLIEAFACGIPVIASRLGALPEMVEDGRTGLLFEPGDITDLSEKVNWAWNHPEKMEKMGNAARREYEKKYTEEKNYNALIEIYLRTLENHHKRFDHGKPS